MLLQKLLPRARIVYCSATSVSEGENLGFMRFVPFVCQQIAVKHITDSSLWYTQPPWTLGLQNGAPEWVRPIFGSRKSEEARHRDPRAARHASEARRRQLSYEACEFELVENVGDERVRRLYNKGEQIQANAIL